MQNIIQLIELAGAKYLKCYRFYNETEKSFPSV